MKRNKGDYRKINKTKSWSFVKINKIDKPLDRLIKKKREENQINKIRNKKGEITTDNTEIQRIIRDYMPIKWTTWEKKKKEKFLIKYNLPKLNEEEIENFYRP